MTMTEVADHILANLDANPPKSLTEAGGRLKELLGALRGSIDEKWAASEDKQAVLSEVSVRIEAAEAVGIALAAVEKAEAAATAALERAWKTLHSPRTEARVWRKLRPAN
jgi:hypothetical protein